MFRVIGGAVVYGLALYGLVKIIERPKMAVVIQPNAKGGEATGDGESKSDAEAQPAVGEMPTTASKADTV